MQAEIMVVLYFCNVFILKFYYEYIFLLKYVGK